MKVVILQPSYIPWRGYFDQIRRADLFIFYDDVQYDKHGWRNRNQIKTSQGKQWLTIPVHTSGVTKGVKIKDVKIDKTKPWIRNHLRALGFSYGRAPYFLKYREALASAFENDATYLADYTVELTIAIARELGITTRFMRSSEMAGIVGYKTERLVQILQNVGAKHYITGPAAKEYIDAEAFMEANITLEFMEYKYPEYPQLYPPYDPNVTILDLLFMTGEEAINFF